MPEEKKETIPICPECGGRLKPSSIMTLDIKGERFVCLDCAVPGFKPASPEDFFMHLMFGGEG